MMSAESVPAPTTEESGLSSELSSELPSYTFISIEHEDCEPYNVQELKRSRHTLFQMVDRGSLSWLRNKMMYHPMKPFTNVWEGERGLMEHIPKPFPMPPCAPYCQETETYDKNPPPKPQETSENHSTTNNEAVEAKKASKTEELAPKSKKAKYERSENAVVTDKYYWLRMSKAYSKLEEANQSLAAIKTKLLSIHEQVRIDACRQLRNLHKKLQSFQEKLEWAEKEASHVSPVNFINMLPLRDRVRFMKQNSLKGQLPEEVSEVVALYDKMRSLMSSILSCKVVFEPANREILKDAIADVLGNDYEYKPGSEEESSTNADTNGQNMEDDELWPDCEGETAESLGQKSDKKLTDEDKFWNSMVTLRRQIGNTTVSVSKVNRFSASNFPENVQQNMIKNNCEQAARLYDRIRSFNETFGKLKEEMKSKKYPNKSIITTEELKRQHIYSFDSEGSSVCIVQAMLVHLMNLFARAIKDKIEMLEEHGFKVDLKELECPAGVDTTLIRVCCHSETVVVNTDDNNETEHSESFNPTIFDKVFGSSEPVTIPETSQARSANDGKTETNQDQDKSTVADSAAEEDWVESRKEDAGQEKSSSLGSKSNGSGTGDGKTITSSTVSGIEEVTASYSPSQNGAGETNPPSGTEPNPAETEKQLTPAEIEFIEKEKQHWDRMQKLYKNIDRSARLVRSKGKKSWPDRDLLYETMKSLYDRMNELASQLSVEKAESSRMGYCTEVTYKNMEFQSQSSARLMVKSIGQVRARMDQLIDTFSEVSKALRVSNLFYD